MVMKLNLGCGNDKRSGFVNVDKELSSEPDIVLNLEQLPWPWETSSVDEILLKHTLEHLGRDPETYLSIIKELWRISKNGASITITVPHPRHDHFINDPTHVRPVTPEGLMLFSKSKNREWVEKGFANTPLGLYLDIDLEVVSVNMVPEQPWHGRFERGEIDNQQLAEAASQINNVIRESTVVLRVLKAG